MMNNAINAARVRKSPVRWAALLLSALILFTCAKGENVPMNTVPVVLQESYKKAGENNPLYTQRFGADPGVMEYDGRLYVYMTDDIVEYDSAGKVRENSYSQIRTINCISSDDMVNWTDHGRIRVAGPGGIAKWANNSWAPCAAHKTIDGQEKFFLYFCNGGNGIGVLSSDSHLAFGGGIPQGKQAAPGTARIVRLGEDMISLAGDPVRLDVPWLFEDSGINKIGDKYVYSYCSNFQTQGNSLKLTDGAIQYMISDNPLGPYTYMGELFPNEGRFFGMYGNNHHSIASLNGEWYLFYHNRPVEKAMGIFGNYRSPQADKIFFGEDGLPKQVKGTMKGLDQVKPLNPFRIVSAATMSRQAGVTVEGANGQSWVNGIPGKAGVTVEGANGQSWSTGIPGSWLQVSGVDFGTGASTLLVTAMAPTDCTLYAVLDQPEGPVVSQLRIELPGDVKPAVFRAPIQAEGVHDLYLITDGEMKLYSWQVK